MFAVLIVGVWGWSFVARSMLGIPQFAGIVMSASDECVGQCELDVSC